MKREILFRGKRKDGKGWVEGYYFFNGHEHGIVTNEGYPGFWHEVAPETVGQLSGLKDRNGMKIFEGDIAMALSESGFDHGKHTGRNFLIYWSDNGAWYVTRDYDESEQEELYPLRAIVEMLVNCDVKIIGNIHDNPELVNQPQC